MNAREATISIDSSHLKIFRKTKLDSIFMECFIYQTSEKFNDYRIECLNSLFKSSS